MIRAQGKSFGLREPDIVDLLHSFASASSGAENANQQRGLFEAYTPDRNHVRLILDHWSQLRWHRPLKLCNSFDSSDLNDAPSFSALDESQNVGVVVAVLPAGDCTASIIELGAQRDALCLELELADQSQLEFAVVVPSQPDPGAIAAATTAGVLLFQLQIDETWKLGGDDSPQIKLRLKRWS